MYCLKCGRETPDNQVFCTACQKNMAQHPVAPGTAIHLPSRPAVSAKRPAVKKRPVPLEEQILNLRRSLRRTRVFALAMLVILAMTAAILLHEVVDIDAPVIGQNYTIDASQGSN